MKQNGEAGEDEASAQLALLSSAGTLPPVAFFGFRWFYTLVGIVPQQMWVLLPVSVCFIDGTGREFQECL